MPDADPAAVAQARDRLATARRVLVVTGAGISTDSGIPDYRGPDGLWTRDPEAERLSSIEHYLADPAVRVRAWQARLVHPVWSAVPNAGHRALVELERSGRLELLVTQNIDGLHQAAGTSPERLVECHGTLRSARCIGCGAVVPMATVLDRVRAGESDPPCARCGGIQKSDTVFFGESLDPADLRRAAASAARADVVLAVGTTLGVYPIAGVVPLAARSGAGVVIVNGGPTAMDEAADVVVRGPISEVLPDIVH